MKNAFYQNFFFWFILLLVAILGAWLYLFLNNEGCPEYFIIDTLQLEQFLGKWYVQFESNLENDDDASENQCGLINIYAK